MRKQLAISIFICLLSSCKKNRTGSDQWGNGTNSAEHDVKKLNIPTDNDKHLDADIEQTPFVKGLLPLVRQMKVEKWDEKRIIQRLGRTTVDHGPMNTSTLIYEGSAANTHEKKIYIGFQIYLKDGIVSDYRVIIAEYK
jgi:hypothetical protein